MTDTARKRADFRALHQDGFFLLPNAWDAGSAVRLAGNAFEPHHAFRVGRNAWGVQFHPEFSAEALKAYLDGLGPTLHKEGLDAVQISTELKDTPEAASVLNRFAQVALAQ